MAAKPRPTRPPVPARATLKVPVPKPRNPLATSPLLAKGGVHEKSASAKRQAARRALKKALDEADN